MAPLAAYLLKVSLLGAVAAQPLPPAGGDACDLATIQSRIEVFNDECCTTPECFTGGACSLDCANVLLPLNNDCGVFLGALYDGDDGTLDGEADVFTVGAEACTVVQPPLAPPGGNSNTCNFASLNDRIVSFNSACCSSDACFEEGVCSVDCALELLPLSIDCGAALDAIYDGTDGFDGTVSMLVTGNEACLQISSQDALSRVQELYDADASHSQCPPEMLDTVAEVEVSAVCRDTNLNCNDFIAMGLECSGLVGQCDATCLLCTPDPDQGPCEDTNENCQTFVSMGMECDGLVGVGCDLTCDFCDQGHRRAQGQNLNCDPATVGAQIERIDEVCCDDTGGVCATGVPTTCDAKCAVFYVDFYERCTDYINLQSTPALQTSLQNLANTCSTALPTEALLLAAAECSGWVPATVAGGVAPADPCADNDCNGRGTCIPDTWPSSCDCNVGYMGNDCEYKLYPCCSEESCHSATCEYSTSSSYDCNCGYITCDTCYSHYDHTCSCSSSSCLSTSGCSTSYSTGCPPCDCDATC